MGFEFNNEPLQVVFDAIKRVAIRDLTFSKCHPAIVEKKFAYDLIILVKKKVQPLICHIIVYLNFKIDMRFILDQWRTHSIDKWIN